MKKLVSLILALALVMCLGVAFADGEKVTIQFWHSMSGGNADSIDYMVKTFNESQDKIEVVATFQGDYYTSIANAIMAVSTGTGPDLIQTGSDQVREQIGIWYGIFKCVETPPAERLLKLLFVPGAGVFRVADQDVDVLERA